MAGFKEYQMLFQLNASVGSGFNSSFSSGQAAVQKLQTEINNLNKTQSDIASYQKQQAAIDKTKAKIELYQTQLTNLQNATATTSKEEAELANAIAAKEKQLTDATNKLDQQNETLSETGEALRAAGVDTNNLSNETARLEAESAALKKTQLEEAESSNALGDALSGAAAAMEAIGAAKALEKVYNVLKDCSADAAAFETAMASVKRTVGGDDSFISDLGETFKSLSTEMPIAASELAAIASTAGQLGIAQENVEGFTTVMAQLATTTDLTADNAATMLAQFANITGTTEYDRLGATVAALGDSTATTASKVVEMSQGMAAAANIAGMSETDILAISAAVGSLGIESQAGSTAMSQLITTLYKATETGDDLESFASVAGMTAGEFSSAWAGDPVDALNAFIQGLNDTERNGKSAMVILDELGISNVRQTKAILGLASAGDLLSNTISQANSAWSENSALAEKAGIMYGTTEARMTMLQNAANNVQIAVGDALNPVLGTLADGLTGLLEPFSELIEQNPAVVQGVTAFVGVLGVATVGLSAYTAATKLAAAASALLGTSMPVLGTILAVAGAIGGLVTIISSLAGANGEAAKSFEELDAEYDSMILSMGENNAILDQIEDCKKLTQETANLKKLMGSEYKTDVEFRPVVDGDPLTNADFGAEGGDVTYTAEAGNTLNPADFGISDQTLKYIAEFQPKGYEDVLQKAKDIGAEILGTDQSLAAARQKLEEMQKEAAKVEEKLSGTKKQKEKSALEEQLQKLNSGIEEQKESIADLEKKHASLQGQYEVTATVASELKTKDEELAAAQAALGISTEGSTESIEEQTQAVLDQLEAKQQLIEADNAEIRANVYKNVRDQASKYAESVRLLSSYEEKAAAASKLAAQARQFEGMSAEDANARYQYLLQSLNDMQNAEGFSADNSQYKQLAEEASALHDIFSGMNDDIAQYADGSTDWVDSFGYLSTNTDAWALSLQGLNEQVVENDQAMQEAQEQQRAFLDNLAEGVNSGAVGIEEVEARLTDAFANEEDGADLLAMAMEYVNGKLAQEADAAEEAAGSTNELAEATDNLSASTGDQGRAIDDIIKDINDLQKAYEESYNAALKSMGGQFKLFEQVDKSVKPKEGQANENVGGYKAALQSQEEFITQYKENLKQAAEAGVDADLLAQLADGSAESAETLANLANASKEQIDELNNEYAALQTSKEEFAATVAEIETNFSSTMTDLQTELSETVQAMDFSAGAAANAKASLEAFIAQAAQYESKVYLAYKRVADRAKAALKFNPTLGYASGTENAERGVHLVGEEGPELVYFRGGEKVLDAQKTASALQATPAVSNGRAGSGGGAGGNSYNIE